MPGSDAAEENEQLAALSSTLILFLVLAKLDSSAQVARVVLTCVPSMIPCRAVHFWHPEESCDYYARAPSWASGALADNSATGRYLDDGAESWSWASPLSSVGGRLSAHLVVVCDRPLSVGERFQISLLAQLSGAIIARIEAATAQRTAARELAEVNAELRSAVDALTSVTDAHRQLNDVLAGDSGEAGIAAVLHRITGLPVLIEDVHGNVRASAGPSPQPRSKPPTDERADVLGQLRTARGALHIDGAWYALASPRSQTLGTVVLLDPERRARLTDTAALEFAATVLSAELARAQSIAEADLRGRRDFAEELLSGGTLDSVEQSARRLGYDLLRPHRVVIARYRRAGRPGDGNFQKVVGAQIRAHDAATLVTDRSDSVIIISNRDVRWAELQRAIAAELPDGVCQFAVGTSHPTAAGVARSYRDAQFVVELAWSMRVLPPEPVMYFETLGVYRLLSAVTDPDGIEKFMNDQLGALVDYDSEHESSLVLTLAYFFDFGVKSETTAQLLHVHRNTVKYRLKRIREILGRDFADGPQRLDLHLATRIWLARSMLLSADDQTSPPGLSRS